MNGEPTIRRITVGDVAFAHAQMQREGWDIADGGMEMHLRHDPDGCFLAEHDNAPIGMVTTTCYGRSGFIGNLIVEPAHRRRGVGEMLMRRAMQRLRAQGAERVELEADAPGVRLYRRLGFVDRFRSLRFRRLRGGAFEEPCDVDVRAITADDLDAIGQLDRPWFGGDRIRLLRELVERSPGAYWIGDATWPAGYLVTQRLSDGLRIGPCAARDAAVFAALLEAVMARHDAPRCTLGLPAVNAAGVELLRARGFEKTSSCLRMTLGSGGYHDEPERIFAIAGGDRG